MLVLTRKIKEEIRIGEDITVTILKVRGQVVRVGVQAPKDVRILRSELSDEGVNSELAFCPGAPALDSSVDQRYQDISAPRQSGVSGPLGMKVRQLRANR